MPAYNHHEIVIQHSEPQIKTCAACQSVLQDPAASVRLPDRDAIVCMACSRDYRSPSQLRIDQDAYLPRRQPFNHEVVVLSPSRRSQDSFDTNRTSHPSPPPENIRPPSPPPHAFHAPSPPPVYSLPTLVQCNPLQHHHDPPSLPSDYSSPPQAQSSPATLFPDPLTDITRLRVRSRGHHCLYPGAEFQGTQKSGRNSYGVDVTIVDVNFPESTLCGYLRIRGLTDDWPELTTYFDAEIIGSRYGFLTQNWGATEHEDLIHWSRFPAFKHVRNEARRPHMTIDDRDRGAVFMRWKERFLVPDHRVHDINGASFAGFYYVCVDFNPPVTPASPSPTRSEAQDTSQQCGGGKPEGRQRSRRDSSVRRRAAPPTPYTPPVATMSGFYYHQNSEPYQQLSLTHIPERASSSFEFR